MNSISQQQPQPVAYTYPMAQGPAQPAPQKQEEAGPLQSPLAAFLGTSTLAGGAGAVTGLAIAPKLETYKPGNDIEGYKLGNHYYVDLDNGGYYISDLEAKDFDASNPLENPKDKRLVFNDKNELKEAQRLKGKVQIHHSFQEASPRVDITLTDEQNNRLTLNGINEENSNGAKVVQHHNGNNILWNQAQSDTSESTGPAAGSSEPKKNVAYSVLSNKEKEGYKEFATGEFAFDLSTTDMFTADEKKDLETLLPKNYPASADMRESLEKNGLKNKDVHKTGNLPLSRNQVIKEYGFNVPEAFTKEGMEKVAREVKGKFIQRGTGIGLGLGVLAGGLWAWQKSRQQKQGDAKP